MLRCAQHDISLQVNSDIIAYFFMLLYLIYKNKVVFLQRFVNSGYY